MVDYLVAHPEHRTLVASSEPPLREYTVNLAAWNRLLARSGIEESRRAAARSILLELPSLPDGTARIGRGTLAQLASDVRQSLITSDGNVVDEVQCLVRLWFAAQIWGGPDNPVSTFQGLTDSGLTESLRASAKAILDGPRDIARAHRNYRVKGTDEPFLTRWLWAVSLGQPDAVPVPVISDKRVHETLRLTDGYWCWTKDVNNYVDYVYLVRGAADAVCREPDLGLVNPEKIEFLLFDGSPRSLRRPRCDGQTAEKCFYFWLRRRTGAY